MNPDETKLALWLDDELSGAELSEMNSWAAKQPEQLAAREELRSFRKMISENIPESEEPPYPEFFNSRVTQGIRDLQTAESESMQPAAAKKSGVFWRSWLLPVTACAGMAFAFMIGKQSNQPSQPLAILPALSPAVYTPEDGVEAQWFSSNTADATVILLQGISDIPDSMDFSKTVYVPSAREADRTATREAESDGAATQ